jgi:lipopolysaccharide/colanic/teichoic acid biosynthesis glycosyltransferase
MRDSTDYAGTSSVWQGEPHAAGYLCEVEPFFNQGVPFWKRMTDIAFAVALIILMLPVFGIIAGMIKSVSRGPVLYRQERIGFRGRRFSFLKFRTMEAAKTDSCHKQYLQHLIACSEGTCPPPMKKLDACNPHIIPLGRFLRSTCLDELPQLVNVVRGEMSLVGPRPPIPYEVTAYRPWHSSRFNCLPGMTGLWQVSGKNRLSFREMVRMDIRYAQRITFWGDLAILIKTPFSIWREYVIARNAPDGQGEEAT